MTADTVAVVAADIVVVAVVVVVVVAADVVAVEVAVVVVVVVLDVGLPASGAIPAGQCAAQVQHREQSCEPCSPCRSLLLVSEMTLLQHQNISLDCHQGVAVGLAGGRPMRSEPLQTQRDLSSLQDWRLACCLHAVQQSRWQPHSHVMCAQLRCD